jgi:general secretion pathway protein G
VSSRADRRRGTPGFTLIEMLVVIAIIATLAAVVAPAIFQNVGDAKSAAARTQIQALGLGLDAYRLDNDGYPTTADGLEALRAAPPGSDRPGRWRGPYLQRVIPADPWGRPYQYVSPGQQNPTSYDLYSLGRDGRVGGTGEDADVTSWGGSLGR